MLSEELLQKVRLIEIKTRRAVDEVISGQYKSHFKGHGVQFSEHRLYVPGDDVRHINWNVSARTKEPLVKKFDEERELTVFLVVDISGSETFGSSTKLKSEIAAEIGGMLAYAACHTGDKVGLLIFAGEVELIIPPKKGRQHILRIIRELLAHTSRSKGTNLLGALEATGRIMKHSGIVFVISDFMTDNYEVALRRLSKKHDIVAVSIGDERETEIPDIGQILLFNPETEEEQLVDTSSHAFKKWFTSYQKQFESKTKAAFKSSRVETLKVLTKEDYGEAVVRFFRARSRKRR
jgi:uncharacterized protein (DUF58 family)